MYLMYEKRDEDFKKRDEDFKKRDWYHRCAKRELKDKLTSKSKGTVDEQVDDVKQSILSRLNNDLDDYNNFLEIASEPPSEKSEESTLYDGKNDNELRKRNMMSYRYPELVWTKARAFSRPYGKRGLTKKFRTKGKRYRGWGK
jgi:hypothetical protein